jgi:predicted transcriptional regulator
MSEDLSREEVHQAVDRMVEELLAAAGVTEPPVDALALAQRHLGMSVCVGARPPAPAPGPRRRPAGGRQQVVLEPGQSAERHQWAVAQAIGAHFKGDLLRRLGVSPEPTRGLMGVSLADLFAEHLLAPTDWFAGDARTLGHDLLDLKARYPTASHEVLAWRLLDLPEPCIITVVDNDHVHRRRSNAFPVRKELETVERACQRYVNQYSRPRVMREDGWTVQGWPVHRPDWKREVLRSVVEEV